MNKYMLTIQHDQQKVAYIEFTSENDKQAKEYAIHIYSVYENNPIFMCKHPYESGNFTGYKPRILNHHVSKWIRSDTATNAWGSFCGGYWSTLHE